MYDPRSKWCVPQAKALGQERQFYMPRVTQAVRIPHKPERIAKVRMPLKLPFRQSLPLHLSQKADASPSGQGATAEERARKAGRRGVSIHM